MKREDLFLAIGEVEEERLAICEAVYPFGAEPREETEMYTGRNKRTSRRSRKLWLIAAIVALMLLLMGSAIAARVTMNVRDVSVRVEMKETQGSEQTGDEESNSGETQSTMVLHEGEKVDFEKTDDDFIELGSWYPQEIPEGYFVIFVSEGAPYQQQSVDYENAAGCRISYTIYIADSASDVEVYDILSKSDVQIRGQQGILYEQEGNGRTLVWINNNQGFGFALRTNDPGIDLIAMAESTAEGEPLVPTYSGKTLEALAELGDFKPESLPEGYVEQGVLGMPLADGSGWYSYVRKWYVNKEENTKVYFEYESYRIDTTSGYTDDARTVCSFFIPGYYILENIVTGEEVEINGMFGIAAGNHIAWADPETHRVFHLYSEDIIGEDLLQFARSIHENP